MRLGVIGCADYPNLKAVQQYISKVRVPYNPPDSYSEEIIIITELKNNLDSVAVIQADRAGFEVELVENIKELIKKSDKIIWFRSKDDSLLKEIDLILKSRKPLEIVYC